MAKKIVTPVEVQASVKGDESVKSLRDTLKEAQQEADKLAKELGKDSDAYKKAAENVAKLKTEIKDGNIKTQLKEAQFEAIRLAQALGQTSPEALKAAGRVAELRDQMDDFNATVKGLHPDRFQKFANITATLANGFAAAQGAAALLGSESEDLQKQMVRVQGAMAFAQGIAGLKDLKFQLGDIPKTIYSKVVPAFTTAAGAARAIGTALGIGVIIAGVTALVAVFKNLDLSIDGVAKKDKDLLKSQEARLKASKDNVDALDAQDNILKLQGKSERDILNLKIAALQTAIDNQKAVIATSKAQSTSQIAAAQRNKDILLGILNFINAPTRLILDTIDLIAEKLGYDTGLGKTFQGLLDSTANLVFDPEETKREAAENEKAMNDELVSMQNTVAGHKLAIKQMDKQAADERVKAAQEETQRLKEEEEKRVKNAADAAKQKLDDEKAAAEEAARQQKLLDDADARLEKERLEEEKRRQDVIDQFEKGRQMAAETRLANERKMLQAQAEFKKTLEENVVSSLNAIADIAGQNSKTAKAIALAQIAYDTGTGLMAALKNTQSTTSVDNQVTGGLAGLAKFAAISAVILTNSARAIRIVKSGNPAGGGNVPAPSPGRGVPQLQSAASSLGGGTQFAGQFDNRVYVTEGDITNTQRRVRQNRGVSVI